jgi:hypothetical protein
VDQTHHQRGWHQLLPIPRRELVRRAHLRSRGIAALEPQPATDAAVLTRQRAISIIDSRTLYHTGSGRNGSGLGHLRRQTFWLEVVHAGWQLLQNLTSHPVGSPSVSLGLRHLDGLYPPGALPARLHQRQAFARRQHGLLHGWLDLNGHRGFLVLWTCFRRVGVHPTISGLSRSSN